MTALDMQWCERCAAFTVGTIHLDGGDAVFSLGCRYCSDTMARPRPGRYTDVDWGFGSSHNAFQYKTVWVVEGSAGSCPGDPPGSPLPVISGHLSVSWDGGIDVARS